jgi:hypothetical protein
VGRPARESLFKAMRAALLAWIAADLTLAEKPHKEKTKIARQLTGIAVNCGLFNEENETNNAKGKSSRSGLPSAKASG